MNNGYNRRNRKRQSTAKHYKIRYDRIVAALLGVAVLIVVMVSCVKAISGDKDSDKKSSKKASSTGSSETSIVDNLDTSSKGGTSGTAGSTAAESVQYTTEQYLPTDVGQGDLILVNSEHPYSFTEGDTELVTLYDHFKSDYYNVSDYVVKLDSDTLSHLDAMMEAFYNAQHNTDIYIIGGYRTIEEQNARYANGDSKFNGGFTDYHTGRTFDMGIFPTDGSNAGYYSATGIYSWIDENAASYGFVVRFPSGKETSTGEESRTYTYRYVGAPHATYMKQNNLCLEEYIEQIKSYTNEKPLEINVGDKLYGVYYVPANAEGNTDVPVPAGLTYQVSGNNVDGFVVTVEMN